MDPSTSNILSKLNIETTSSTSTSISNSSISPYRIFVRNLPPNTSEEMLRAFFNRIGSVVDALIFLDPFGVPLDLAMVSFLDECVADFFAQRRFHDFFGTQIETVELLSTEIALAMEQEFGANLHPGNSHTVVSLEPQPRQPPGMSKDTIFVLNVRPNITKKVLRSYFNQFGVVKNVAVTRKGNKKKRVQGFHAFVTFVSKESVRGALLLEDEDDEVNGETFHEILGVKVQVKRSRI